MDGCIQGSVSPYRGKMRSMFPNQPKRLSTPQDPSPQSQGEGQGARCQPPGTQYCRHAAYVGVGWGNSPTGTLKYDSTSIDQVVGDVVDFQPHCVTKSKPTMGSAVSADPVPQNALMFKTADPLPPAPLGDLRGTIPPDLLQVNTTAMGEPVRRLFYPDGRWVTLETGQPPHFHSEPIINPKMEHLDQWRARSKIPIPAEILPVAKHRMMNSMPEMVMECTNEERMQNALGGAMVLLTKTGPKKDTRRSLAALSILHKMHPAKVRAGRPLSPRRCHEYRQWVRNSGNLHSKRLLCAWICQLSLCA